MKIGFVNLVKLIEEAPQGEAATKKIEAEFSPRDNAIRKKQKKYSSWKLILKRMRW